MKNILAIALGGSIGSIGRYFIALAAARVGGNFPLGTFVANVCGCLFIGFFWSWFDRVEISHEFRLFLFTGFLGGFTTFSTYARESVQFFRAGESAHAIAYLIASNIVGLAFVFAGFLLAEKYIRL
ncbi:MULTISPECIES: fluoride efflux transporter CrcB [Desulfosediminicola]|uniref:fluoride efflux transporter CrcB n=1 Tax=Desulfosediminicola TaxID=2886823 RepID=UPI0010AD41DA|nr:fluoride efflux transporter CrcB [Desulfosediminicola ganghwensis]